WSEADTIKQAMQETVADLSGILRLHEAADQELFSSAYRETLPFVRVLLDSFFATVDGEEIGFDVTVTIHQSGIAILAVYGVFSRTFSTDDLIKLRRSQSVILHSCKIPVDVFKRHDRLIWGKRLVEEHLQENQQDEEDKRYITLDRGETPLTLFDALY